MRKRIFRSICLVTVVVLLLSLIIISGNTVRYFSKTQEQHIKNQLELVANGVELSGKQYFDLFPVEGIRVTWISKSGTVLFDTEKDASEMENHQERPEVKDALSSGTGESVRYSSTLLEKQLYCAKKLSDGGIIRISDNQTTLLTLLPALVRPICLILLLFVVLAFFAAKNLSRKIVEPINAISPEKPLETQTYEELQPLLNKLTVQQNLLKQDRVELEKTERIRQEFTGNVSHELKTPLHAISGYAELLKNGLVAEKDIRPFATKIYDESTRLAALVEDVIDLSRLDSRMPELESEETDLYRVAENVIDSLAVYAEEKHITVELTGNHTRITGIPQLLHSIIYNLCDNAIKYNNDGGTVTVKIAETEDRVLLTVGDNGIGISEEHIPRIFERFYRVDKSHSKEVGGTGLGLSIVKHAAALHHAAVSVNSAPGKGTEISVAFPKNDFT